MLLKTGLRKPNVLNFGGRQSFEHQSSSTHFPQIIFPSFFLKFPQIFLKWTLKKAWLARRFECHSF
jgi:hypothetical protein